MSDPLAKMAADLAKARALNGELRAERDTLVAIINTGMVDQIADLKKMIGAQPVPRHLVGRAVNKAAEDADAPAANTLEKALAAMAPEERADLLIKIAQQSPVRMDPA